jgi:Rod binding domain-containing protein
MIELSGILQNMESRAGRAEGEVQKEDLKKVAKEMESLFAFQLLKVMRETADSISTEKKGNGHDTYMSLFDMEISKLLSERGLGLQDAIVKGFERVQQAHEEGPLDK